jgi:hypothetical protein
MSMVRTLLALCFALLLPSCASTSAPPLRFVDCTQTDYCGSLDDWPDPSWSAKHEALYRRGVRSILHEMACGKMVERGRRLAYVAADDLSVPCASGQAQIRYVKDRDHGNRLLAAGRIDYLVEFERANASKVRGGIEVPLTASFYARTRRTGTDSRLEGMDNYLIVQTEAMAEVRLISRATHE